MKKIEITKREYDRLPRISEVMPLVLDGANIYCKLLDEHGVVVDGFCLWYYTLLNESTLFTPHVKFELVEVNIIPDKHLKIYLGCPYTGTEQERKDRFNIVNIVAAKLMSNGHIVFSPISHGHCIALAGENIKISLPTDWQYWEQSCKSFIDWCDVVHILTLKGWVKSVGVQAEIKYAESIGKKIEYINNI